MSIGIPSSTPQMQSQTGSNAGSWLQEYGIENTDYKTTAGVDLSDRQKLLVGSVLDLFAGRPSLKKLSLWTDTATFLDPLTISKGRKKYTAQWYGLQAAFSEVQRLKCEITSAGNPIEIRMETRYKVKGLGIEKDIESLVRVYATKGKEEMIEKVEDRWDGELPEGEVAKVFRNLNASVVPAFVRVPKNEEEDRKRGN